MSPPNSNPTTTGDDTAAAVIVNAGNDDSASAFSAGSTPHVVDVDENDPRKKVFFTTSDLIERMNSAMRRASPDDCPMSSSSSAARTASPSSASSLSYKSSENCFRSMGASGGFELHARMPDGSYRPARQSEMAAADFQSKLRQASEAISGMGSRRKLQWAERQRRMGNALFERGEYVEAMDVYLTCLVAVDRAGDSTHIDPSPGSTNGDDVENISVRMEREIQLPVLLNLALCAMKMGMLSKAERFCNFAIDETSCGKISPKAHFRRGRARLLMGRYPEAESDLDAALGMLSLDDVAKVGCDHSDGGVQGVEVERTRAVVLREKQRLRLLVERAERNRKAQKRAMERFFGSSSLIEDDKGMGSSTADCVDDSPSLYPEKRDIAQLFPRSDKVIVEYNDDGTIDNLKQRSTYFQWYLRMLGRCAQKILDIIGDEQGDGPEVVPSSYQRDLANATSMIECKKDA
ncbi:hypothetical protein ACHAXA_005333 [Cyclostephanos tholiformis]|uniref:Uncharacterized protein n=1 Tax=Cyclostephanos tholiformis TaxID=382380 RepID=A0ABD3RA77_9STRA